VVAYLEMGQDEKNDIGPQALGFPFKLPPLKAGGDRFTQGRNVTDKKILLSCETLQAEDRQFTGYWIDDPFGLTPHNSSHGLMNMLSSCRIVQLVSASISPIFSHKAYGALCVRSTGQSLDAIKSLPSRGLAQLQLTSHGQGC